MSRTAYMFGFRKSSPDETGWLRIGADGKYQVAPDRESATGFETENASGRKGWGSPERWCGFFNSEESLADWRFHVVFFTEERRKRNG